MVDEAHRMRNKNSALLGCLQQVVHNGMSVHAYQHRVLMTGTPMQNIKEELWPLMNFIDQANFPDLGRFQEKYCKGEPGHEVDEVCGLFVFFAVIALLTRRVLFRFSYTWHHFLGKL